MKKIFNILIIAVLSLFVVSCGEDTIDIVGVGNVTGRVVKAKTFEPIENAKITISQSNNTVFTDVDGNFKMEEIKEGDYSVSAIKDGFLTSFVPATVSTGTDVNVIFEMEIETALNRPPSTPVLDTPTEGVEEQEISVEFIWSSKDPDEDEIEYRLEIKNDFNSDIIKVNNLVDTTYVVSDLKYGAKYFWQIAATDKINDEVLSAVGTFKTKVDPENRYFYVKKNANGNNVIYSANVGDNAGESINEVKLTTIDNNSWRPRKNQTSNLIAFLRTSGNETHLFTMMPDGSGITQVSSAIPLAGYDLNKMDFAWASNGSRLIYSSYDKLYVINKDGSGLQQIYKTTDGSFIAECDWSNDESMIAIKTNDITGYNVSIFTINMSGAILNNVLSGVNGAAGGLNISINNKLLVYTYDISEFENSNNRQLDTHVFIYDLVANSTTDISEDKEDGTIDLDPRFSPNESEIIFVNTSNDGVSPISIYGMSVGGGDRALLFSNAKMPDWE